MNPRPVEDVELLQDLVAAAFNDANQKTQELARQQDERNHRRHEYTGVDVGCVSWRVFPKWLL